ncbi:cytochrome P450 71AU50-like [Salvia miltiorrhiza]|uniref:cytochrome P450 71AU50-like n=1 Tax=Salvia miltiorrhiza TaxID=226208 RepID=UPI0025AC1746|nr:cytochrome P450 71AU50-like [Salvia miltiorrhiza]
MLQNLLVGGTDTAAAAVEWAVHEILKQPRTIEKAKAELNSVIGGNRWVEKDDLTHLPYINAIIMETMRLHPIATLLGPHCAIEDCNVAGYNISKGTVVLVNVWSIGRNLNSWNAPQEFLPERFVGKEIEMITGIDFAVLPFGSGRRRCPGINLGLKTVGTTLANLLHGFELKLEEGMRP